MVSPLAQSDHKRSPGRTGVALVLALDVEIMVSGEVEAHSVPANKTVKSYFAFFLRFIHLTDSAAPRPGVARKLADRRDSTREGTERLRSCCPR